MTRMDLVTAIGGGKKFGWNITTFTIICPGKQHTNMLILQRSLRYTTHLYRC